MQIISQEKILPWELMALKESDLNGYCPKGILVTFWKKAGFEGGEREIDLLVHAHCVISLFSSIFSSFPCFLSYLFLFFLLFSFTLLSFYSVSILCFSIPFLGHGKGPFIVLAVASFLPLCPINHLCLVWAYLPTTKSV